MTDSKSSKKTAGALDIRSIIGLLLNIGMRPGFDVSPEPFRWRIRAC